MPTSGDVIRIDLGRPEGHEAGFRHPAVIVTAQRILDAGSSILHVVPLTSTLRRFDTEVVLSPDSANGLARTSAAQCQHVRSIAQTRVAETLGNVGPIALAQIRESIAIIIDVP